MRKDSYFSLTKKSRKLFLLNEIFINNSITQAKISDKINTTRGMVNKYLKELVRDNFVIKDQYNYKITKKGKLYLSNNINDLYIEYDNFKDKINNLINRVKDVHFKEYNFGVLKSIEGVIPFIAKKYKFDQKYGFKFNLYYYDTGLQLIDNLEVEKLDFGVLGVIPAFYKKSLGSKISIDFKINGGKHSLLYKNKYKNIEDLEGQKILLLEKNDSVSGTLLKDIEREKNISFQKIDLNDINCKIEDLINNDIFEKAEGVLIWEPYISFIKNKNQDIKIYNIDKDYISNVCISSLKNERDKIKVIEKIFEESIKYISRNDISNEIEKVFNVGENYINNNLTDLSFSIQREGIFK